LLITIFTKPNFLASAIPRFSQSVAYSSKLPTCQAMQSHWENVYTTKEAMEVSWFQPDGQPSLGLIEECSASRDQVVVDSGCGDGFLIEGLIQHGYKPEKLVGIDISAHAVERSRQRLGNVAQGVHWIVEDVSKLTAEQVGKKVDIWHDRATFHFLVQQQDIQHYVSTVSQSVKNGGHLVLATFAEDGPEKCSGLAVTRYSLAKLDEAWGQHGWQRVSQSQHNHATPWNSKQSFLYAIYQRS